MASRPASPRPEQLSAHFEDLEVLEWIGAGGMGTVYKARQLTLDRIVALKILPQRLASDPILQERFEREARLLARLHHPNIVTIFEAGTAGPLSYILMEYVPGENLRQAARQGRFTPEEAIALTRDLCEPLQFAHAQGVLHRDIKPENILLTPGGGIKVADFGIATLLGETFTESSQLTQQNAALGSPRYMAPEQFHSANDTDPRADVYALGVVLYELLTNQLPTGQFDPPSKLANVDPRVDSVVLGALTNDRDQRTSSVAELQRQLDAILSPHVDTPANETPNAVATRAALLTGTSLILAPVGAAYFFMMLENNRENLIRDSTLYLILAVELVIVGLPAMLGMLFGWRSLSELRGDPTRLRGLDTALIGALSWPLVASFTLVGGTLWSIADAVRLPLPLPLFVMASLLLGLALAAKLAHGVYRWVRPEPQRSPAA
jgi:serine/threonine protein kinase